MTAKQFSQLKKEMRTLIKAHLKQTGESPSAFAREAKIHPLQMLGFLNETAGLTLDSAEKIGALILKREKARK